MTLIPGPIRGMCACGYPYAPEVAYDGTRPWSGRKPRRFCSKRCSRQWPARARAYIKAQERLRSTNARWEAAGQLTLW